MQMHSSQEQNLSCTWHDDMLDMLPEPQGACKEGGPLTMMPKMITQIIWKQFFCATDVRAIGN